MDVLNSQQRKKNMQAIKSKGTKIETLLYKALRAKGYYFRQNSKWVFGKPDLSLKKWKIAIFCDGEFWHGKDFEKIQATRLTTNREYWLKKIQRNILRDQEVNKKLLEDSWIVLRFWEKDLKKELDSCVKIIDNAIKNRLQNVDIT